MRASCRRIGAVLSPQIAWLVPVASVLAAGAVGCGDGGNPWPPRLPQERGPGAVSGAFVLRGPSLAIYTEGPQQVAPPIYSGWQAHAGVGLFREGAANVVRELPEEWLQPSSAQQGTLSIPLEFTDVSLGTYRVRLFYAEYSCIDGGGFLIYRYLSTGEPFTLDAATPAVSGRQEEWGLLGPPPYCEVSGELLVNGNSMGDAMLQLGLYTPYGSAGDGIDQLSAAYHLPTVAGQFGRVFYKLSKVPIDSFYFGASGHVPPPLDLDPGWRDPHLRVGGLISSTDLLELRPDTEIPRVDIFCPRFADPRGSDGYDDPLRQGRILATVRFVGATNWSSDIVVVGERVGTSSGSRSMATYFILPMDLRLDRSVECFLGYLDPGTCTVSVYQLGETNADPPLRLALASSIDLPVPPLANDVDNFGNPIAYQPPPLARVSLDVDLPAE